MQTEPQTIQQDTIDLRELLAVLKRRKRMIGTVTTLITLLAIMYAFFIAKPIYEGKLLIEIGKVINQSIVIKNNKNNKNNWEPTTISYLDEANDLKNILVKLYPINVSIPKKTDSLLQISYESSNIDTINPILENVLNFVINRHKENIKLYQGKKINIKMTQKIGDITVSDTPVKPRKKLIVIVAFITGLMLSVFLAFFLEFLRGMKEEEK